MNAHTALRWIGTVLAAFLLVGGAAGAAAADGGPLVKSKQQAGVNILGLLDAGAKSETTGLGSKADTKVSTAGVNLDTDADVDIDLVASVLASLG